MRVVGLKCGVEVGFVSDKGCRSAERLVFIWIQLSAPHEIKRAMFRLVWGGANDSIVQIDVKQRAQGLVAVLHQQLVSTTLLDDYFRQCGSVCSAFEKVFAEI